VKIIKFDEQNRNRAVEREFSVNEAHIHYWRKQKEGLWKAKCSVRAFKVPKLENFLSLKKNYLNTSRKRGNERIFN
jgi:hypothetical protein